MIRLLRLLNLVAKGLSLFVRQSCKPYASKFKECYNSCKTNSGKLKFAGHITFWGEKNNHLSIPKESIMTIFSKITKERYLDIVEKFYICQALLMKYDVLVV